LSLDGVATLAEIEDIAELSKVAVMKRLRKAAPWLERLLEAVLAERIPQPLSALKRPLRLIDGTTLSAPGRSKPDWRFHLVFDVGSRRLDALTLTSAKSGESLARVAIREGDLVMADRGFVRPDDLRGVHEAGAGFLARLGSRQLRLLDQAGRRFDVMRAIHKSARDGLFDQPVQIAHGRNAKFQPVAARLIVMPLSPEAAARGKKRLQRAAQRERYAPSRAALKAAEHLILITSVTPDILAASQVADLYRLRWQIELAIKRLKSIAELSGLPAKTPDLARTWMAANLITALIAEDLTIEVLDAPP
jgi:IS4 transposase